MRLSDCEDLTPSDAAAVWYNLTRRNAMLTKSELEKLLASTETCRVGRGFFSETMGIEYDDR